MERFNSCAFFNIIDKGTPNQRQDTIKRMCKPFCKEECPVNLPILEFTGDSVVPYVEEFKEEEFYVQGTA